MHWALTRSSTCVTRLIKTDAQDHRGSLDRHSDHVAALTYSMNTLLQIAYDISFPPIGIYRAVLSLNITILKVWFPILLHSCNDSTLQLLLCVHHVVSFVLLKSGYKSDNFWTNVRDNLTKASSGRGLVIISDI